MTAFKYEITKKDVVSHLPLIPRPIIFVQEIYEILVSVSLEFLKFNKEKSGNLFFVKIWEAMNTTTLRPHGQGNVSFQCQLLNLDN